MAVMHFLFLCIEINLEIKWLDYRMVGKASKKNILTFFGAFFWNHSMRRCLTCYAHLRFSKNYWQTTAVINLMLCFNTVLSNDKIFSKKDEPYVGVRWFSDENQTRMHCTRFSDAAHYIKHTQTLAYVPCLCLYLFLSLLYMNEKTDGENEFKIQKKKILMMKR